MKPLIEEFEVVCNKYINVFSKKHDIEFTGWVADEIGEIAVFIEQYFFNFKDIRYDIDNNCPKGAIFEWQEFCVENEDYDETFPEFLDKNYKL